MKPIRIMIVCSFGIGTSLILKMTLDEVLKANHIKAETFTSDTDTALGQRFDCVLTSKDLANIFGSKKQPVIIINNFINKDEVEAKIIPVIKQLSHA